MDGDGVAAVLEIVALLKSAVRQLSFLSDRDKPCSEFEGGGSSKNETARIDSDDRVDRAGLETVNQQINAACKETRIGQHRSDVLELDARLWEIRHVANRFLQLRRSHLDVVHR